MNSCICGGCCHWVFSRGADWTCRHPLRPAYAGTRCADGLVIGVSAAACDMVNSIVAAFGITLVSDFITLEQYWIRLVGGIILS